MNKNNNFTVTITKLINYREIFEIYKETGWISNTEKFKTASLVDNSFCFAIARNNGKIIGMGRSISDGVSDAYIQDVAVLKKFRGRLRGTVFPNPDHYNIGKSINIM